MRNTDIFAMSVRNLFKRKTRTFLTVLGVVIGTAAIVIMVSLGLAMNRTFEEQLEMLGDLTVVTVYNPQWYGGAAKPGEKRLALDKNAVQMFRTLPGVVTATPLMNYYLIGTSGRYVSTWLQVLGIYPDAMEAMGYVLAEGRFLQDNDKMNVIFGAEAATSFGDIQSQMVYRPGRESDKPRIDPMTARFKVTYDWDYYSIVMGNPVDENVQPKLFDMKCVGVLEPKGYPADFSIFMDINQVINLQKEQNLYNAERSREYGWNQGSREQQQLNFDQAYVKCTDLNQVKKVKAIIEEMGYYAEIPSQSLDSMESISNSLQSLLAAIGAVAFLVAALGIANTMVTAIYERTREIGIMKVVGATLSDIKKLFLTEAALIGFMGGLFGAGLSLGISHILNTSGMRLFSAIREFSMQSTISLVTPELCGLAVLFATVMGVVSGYFPANRAMRLSALSAIRMEN